jgi:gas vesicle protein
MSTGKFLAGCIIGGAIGAVAGILLAPRTGEETRELWTENSKEMVQKTDKTVKEIQSKTDEVVCEMQKKGEEIMEKIQGMINKQKDVGEEQ